VIIAETPEEAAAAVDDMFDGAFGGAGAEVVIEEFMTGEEASLFALVDGPYAIALASAQDHKRVGEGDTGPNTGGMGAYSPAPVLTPKLEARAMREIVEPTARAMAEAGTPFSGVLYAGLMLTDAGPKLIEYNVRFGDPECEAIMPRIEGDFAALLHAVASGVPIEAPKLSEDTTMTVIVAAKGYPGTPAKGGAISGLDQAESIEGVTVFQAGTTSDGERIVASGGRVLAVTARGRSLGQARERAYAAIDAIDFADGFHRRDIGWRELERAS
jgi:phosphoribosylamine--glycine ligase